jgi:hypothetical protein
MFNPHSLQQNSPWLEILKEEKEEKEPPGRWELYFS